MKTYKNKSYFEVRKKENAGLALIEIAIAPLLLSLVLSGLIFLLNLIFPIIPNWLLKTSIDLLKLSVIPAFLYLLLAFYAFFIEPLFLSKSNKKNNGKDSINYKEDK